MSGSWLSRVRALLAGVLIAGALTYLQILDAEKELFSALCAYALIAAATLLALGTARSTTKPDLLCLVATATFFFYVIIRAFFSPVGYVARNDLYCVLGGLTLYGLTLSTFVDSNRRIALLVALLSFAVVHVLVSLVQFGLGANYDLIFPALSNVEHSTRGAGLYVDPDHLAGLLEVLGVLGLAITVWSRWPNWSRVCVGYLTAICYFGLVLTGSRGGYGSAATSLILFLFLSFTALRAASFSYLLKFGGIGLAVLLVIVLSGWLFIHENAALQSAINRMTDLDRGRLQLWQAAVEQWKLRPLLGTGSGTYLFYGRQFRSPLMQEDPIDVHNDYLHLLCEYGILGGVGFLFFFFVHLRHGWHAFTHLGPKRIAAGSSLRSDRLALNIGALSAIASYVVHSAVDFNLHIPANALLLAFVFGLIANPALRAQDSTRPPRFAHIVVPALAAILLLQSARLLPGEYLAEKARAALQAEDPSAAIQFAEKAIAYEKYDPETYFFLGRALVSLGNKDDEMARRRALYERALQAIDHARVLAPLDETYPLEMARIYDRLRRPKEAESMFALARQLDPRSDAIAQLYQAHLEAQQNSPNESSHP